MSTYSLGRVTVTYSYNPGKLVGEVFLPEDLEVVPRLLKGRTSTRHSRSHLFLLSLDRHGILAFQQQPTLGHSPCDPCALGDPSSWRHLCVLHRFALLSDEDALQFLVGEVDSLFGFFVRSVCLHELAFVTRVQVFGLGLESNVRIRFLSEIREVLACFRVLSTSLARLLRSSLISFNVEANLIRLSAMTSWIFIDFSQEVANDLGQSVSSLTK